MYGRETSREEHHMKLDNRLYQPLLAEHKVTFLTEIPILPLTSLLIQLGQLQSRLKRFLSLGVGTLSTSNAKDSDISNLNVRIKGSRS